MYFISSIAISGPERLTRRARPSRVSLITDHYEAPTNALKAPHIDDALKGSLEVSRHGLYSSRSFKGVILLLLVLLYCYTADTAAPYCYSCNCYCYMPLMVIIHCYC
jgi:hypothetical protein